MIYVETSVCISKYIIIIYDKSNIIGYFRVFQSSNLVVHIITTKL